MSGFVPGTDATIATFLLPSNTGELVRLFHPRTDQWKGHCEWPDLRLSAERPLAELRFTSSPSMIRVSCREGGTHPRAGFSGRLTQASCAAAKSSHARPSDLNIVTSS